MIPYYFGMLLVAVTVGAVSRPLLSDAHYPSLLRKNASAFEQTNRQKNLVITEKSIATSVFAQPAESGVQWLLSGRQIYLFDTAANQWKFSFRDTSLYNSNGKEIGYKHSDAKAGWSIESLSIYDSTVWDGLRKIKRIGIYDSSTWRYSNDFKRCVYKHYGLKSRGWVLTTMDTTVCATPFVHGEDGVDFSSPNFLSSRNYYTNEVSSEVFYGGSCSKITAESNDSLQVVIMESVNPTIPNKFDSTKYVIRFLKNGRRDSSITKNDAGNWVNGHISYDSLAKDGTRLHIDKRYRYGAWVNSALVIESDTERHEFDDWDTVLNVWKTEKNYTQNAGEKTWDWTVIERDVNGQKETNIQGMEKKEYDTNGNTLWIVTMEKRGADPWKKTDSTVYFYIKNASSTKPASLKGNPNRSLYTVTSQTLCIHFPAITSLRLYDIAGRLILSVNQQPVPILRLNLKRTGSTRIPVGKYIVQVDAQKSKMTFPLLLLND